MVDGFVRVAEGSPALRHPHKPISCHPPPSAALTHPVARATGQAPLERVAKSKRMDGGARYSDGSSFNIACTEPAPLTQRET